MKCVHPAWKLSPVLLAILMSACGGGSSESSQAEPQTGAATDVEGSPAEPSTDTQRSVSGRVADGYIRGAIVCVDVNENDACDEGEPSSVSGPGGEYDLNIAPEHADKPVVASIPAEAIDEDTGQAIGKDLVFMAPADKPEFLSPITTLVQQELRANPALDLEEAESAVKSVLGIDEEEVSLFTDYVEAGADEMLDDETSERFRYLHDTARVVASMMKDIESQVETAAEAKGLDIAGDEETRKAIRDIVRSEVRDLLPQIAQQVAQLVDTPSQEVAEGEASEPSSEFNPDTLAQQLRPDDADKNIEERIEASKDRPEVERSDVKQILTDGVYWMEFDCEFPEGDYPTDEGYLVDEDSGVEDQFDPSYFQPECNAYYGEAKLNAAGDTLSSVNYAFDKSTASWIEQTEEQSDSHSDYSLVNGEWVQVTSNGPEGAVTFDADGVATIADDEGVITLKSASQSLDGKPVLHHLWDSMADPYWFELVQREELFNSGSQAHSMSVNQASHPYVLFNAPAYEEGESCADYADNCNVVESVTDQGSMLVSSLDEVREAATQEVTLVSSTAGFGPDLNMVLMAEVADDGSFPTAGKVVWEFNEPEYMGGPDDEYGYPPGGEDPYVTYPEGQQPPIDVCEGYFPPDGEAPFDPTQDGQFGPEPGGDFEPGIDGEFGPEPGGDFEPGFGGEFGPEPGGDFEPGFGGEFGPEPGGDFEPGFGGEYPPGPDHCLDIAAATGIAPEEIGVDGVKDPARENRVEEGEFSPFGRGALESEWKLIEVQGVKMIEISLPFLLRHDDGLDSEEALLLIEQDGFVRVGARLPSNYVDRVVTYNESALTTLRAIVEDSMAEKF